MPYEPLGAHLPWAQRDRYLPLLLDLALVPEISVKAPDLDALDLSEVKAFSARIKRTGHRPTVHAPFFDLNPGALEPLVRQATLKRLQQTLTFAAQLDARLVVVHPGFDPWRYPGMESLWVQQALSFFDELLSNSDCPECPLAIENIYEKTPATLVSLVDTFASDQLGHCFDIGHWNMFGQTTLKDWLCPLGPRLMHLHLHDNHGDSDAHMPVGSGNIDFLQLLSHFCANTISPTATLEAHSPDDLIKSCDAFRAMN